MFLFKFVLFFTKLDNFHSLNYLHIYIYILFIFLYPTRKRMVIAAVVFIYC